MKSLTRHSSSIWFIMTHPKSKSYCSTKRSFQSLKNSKRRSKTSTKNVSLTSMENWPITFPNLPRSTLTNSECLFAQSMVRDSISVTPMKSLHSNPLQPPSITARPSSNMGQNLSINTLAKSLVAWSTTPWCSTHRINHTTHSSTPVPSWFVLSSAKVMISLSASPTLWIAGRSWPPTSPFLSTTQSFCQRETPTIWTLH